MKRIAVVTCAKYPGLTPDDLPLAAAFGREGSLAEAAVWNDPAVSWAAYDAIVVRSPWDYFLHYDAFLAWLAARERDGRPVLNPVPVLRRNVDKSYLRDLEARGIPIIPTAWLAADGDPEAWIRAAAHEDLVVKPAVSADGFHTYRIRRSDFAADLPAVRRALRRAALMLQPFVPSVQSRGETSLVYVGGEFSHAVTKLPAAGDFKVQASHGGSLRRVDPEPAWRELAERVLATELECSGLASRDRLLYARVDLLEWEGRPVLGELELAEPALYFGARPEAVREFAAAVTRRI